MATTKSMLRHWFDYGVAQGATHMIIKWDSFDGEDYPVYVVPGENAYDVAAANSERTMECYDLRMDREAQMDETRAFHWE